MGVGTPSALHSNVTSSPSAAVWTYYARMVTILVINLRTVTVLKTKHLGLSAKRVALSLHKLFTGKIGTVGSLELIEEDNVFHDQRIIILHNRQNLGKSINRIQ